MKTFISIIDTQKQTNDVNQLTSDLFYKLKRENLKFTYWFIQINCQLNRSKY
jgi:hypothetical protein